MDLRGAGGHYDLGRHIRVGAAFGGMIRPANVRHSRTYGELSKWGRQGGGTRSPCCSINQDEQLATAQNCPAPTGAGAAGAMVVAGSVTTAFCSRDLSVSSFNGTRILMMSLSTRICDIVASTFTILLGG